MSNPFSGIYFTKNDIWRTIGLILIIAGQFQEKTISYIYKYDDGNTLKFETSELTLVGVAIAIIVPLLMRKWKGNQ